MDRSFLVKLGLAAGLVMLVAGVVKKVLDLEVSLMPAELSRLPGSVRKITLTAPPRPPAETQGVVIDVWLADHSQRSPLIVFAPGYDGRRNSSPVMLARLALEGYIVAEIDDVGGMDEVPEQAKGRFALDSGEAMQASLALANRRLELMVARTRRALDYLLALDESAPSSELAGRIDHGKVGMLGFSFGGSLAAEMTLLDDRIACAANLDGWLFGRSAREGARPPYMAFNSDFPGLESAARSWRPGLKNTALITIEDRALQSRQSASDGFYSLFVDGAEHSDFTDALFKPTLRSMLMNWRGMSERKSLHAQISRYIDAFFATYLRADTSDPILRLGKSPYAGIRVMSSMTAPDTGVTSRPR